MKSQAEPSVVSLHPRQQATPGGGGRRSGGMMWHIAAMLLFAALILLVNPRGYTGGGLDDGRYLAAATQWAMHGPVLGQDHWSLRWPLVLPTAMIIRLFGMSVPALMMPGILSFLALALLSYLGVRSAVGERAGLLAGLGVMATPGLACWISALYVDLLEATLWSGAFWCLWRAAQLGGRPSVSLSVTASRPVFPQPSQIPAQARRQLRAMIAMGLLTGLAICVRETSIALAIGLVLAALYLPQRMGWRLWAIAGTCAAIMPVAEYAILWVASGDPLYRLHVDMGHLAIPTNDMQGGVAKGQSAILNTAVMERWDGAGPVRLHWLVDTYINAFLNIGYGLNFLGVAVLGLWWRRREGAGRQSDGQDAARDGAVQRRAVQDGGVQDSGAQRAGATVTALSGRMARGLIPALCALAFVNVVWNLYVLTLNPSARMFMPATVCAAVIVAVLADRLWRVRGARRLVIGMMAVKILATIIVADTIPNYRNAASVASRIAPSEGRVHVGWLGWSQMVFTDPALRRRLDLTPAPVGGALILYSNRRELLTEHLAPGRWRLIRIGHAAHDPWTFRAINGLAEMLGLGRPIRFKDVEVRLFRRLPGDVEADGGAVVVGKDGAAMPADARSL